MNTTEKRESELAKGLHRAHKNVMEDLKKLEEAAGAATPEGLAQVRSRLTATQKHIGDHFRFEEENGYMDKVRKREPRLVRAIEHLVEEHRQLAQSLSSLIAQAKVATTPDGSLREGVRQWVDSVRQHELRENELVQDAFNLDIGAED